MSQKPPNESCRFLHRSSYHNEGVICVAKLRLEKVEVSGKERRLLMAMKITPYFLEIVPFRPSGLNANLLEVYTLVSKQLGLIFTNIVVKHNHAAV